MRALVVGTGATGSRTARQLLSGTPVSALTLIDHDVTVAEEVAHSLGEPAKTLPLGAIRLETRLERLREAVSDVDVVVLTTPEDHVDYAQAALDAGAHVVSTSDDLDTVAGLLAMDGRAKQLEKLLVVGAGFAPGLSDILLRHAASQLDVIDEVHTAKFGTGGPACARQHHKALRNEGVEWRNGGWERRRGGGGRDLAWFPDPVGGLDCYFAELAEPTLNVRAFPQLVRASARVAATRRDRSTAWLPMLRRPHPEGLIGAIRVEVRGWTGNARETVVFGALDRPAVAAGTVAALAASWAHEGRFARQAGAGGLSELLDDASPMLRELHERGVKAAVFEGSSNVHKDYEPTSEEAGS